MEIRAAEPGDAGGILDALAASARAAYAELMAESDLRAAFLDLDAGALAERLEGIRSDDDVVYLVAVDGDRVVGYAQFRCGDRFPDHLEGDAYLQSLYVRPERWGEGIGGDLLAEGIARLPSGSRRLVLSVFSDNDRAKDFYEAHGFERTGEGSFEIDDTAYPTDVYSKRTD